MNAPVQLTPPAIGEIWPGQGGIYGGIRQYPEGLCHIIFSAEDVPGRHEWGPYGDKVEGADSRTDGRANTAALITREGNHPAAIVAAGYSADGHSDFYLPSAGELHHAWQYLPESFATDRYYWSSSQFSAHNAYIMAFEHGWLINYSKDYERLVRPVRRFLQ